MDKAIIGIVEKIMVIGNKTKEVKAKMDTGSYNSSIDIGLASELELGPIVKSKKIRSSHGSATRPFVRGKVNIKGIEIELLFHVADRNELRYPVLIGRKALKKHFLIDPSKK